MFFWRAKKDRSEADKAADDGAGGTPAEPQIKIQDGDAGAPSNVVTLQPSRLSDRLAQTMARASGIIEDAVVVKDTALNAAVPDAPSSLPGQDKAFDVMRAALRSASRGHHLLVLGPAGTGRHSSLRKILDESLPALPRPKDWVYVAGGGGGAALKIVTLPSGEGPAFAGEVEAALGKSQSAFERLLSSDDYGIGLKVLDEEFKQSHDSAFDVLKRRAELQNIALVKTSDGFVLAPMHEGRVVKTEVFRSLPEGLQRDVESKISGLEDELKALISDVPGHVAAYGEKLAALNTEVAVRALGPQLAHVRTLFTGSTEAADALDALESLLVAHAARTVGAKGRAGVSEVFNIRLIARDPGVGGDGMAPAVTAWDVSAPGLSGELGRDTDGRLTLKPGALMQANGGFLIVDAWRLAAMPGAWEVLSAALEQGFVRPISSHGLIASCEALPLSVRLILVADEASWRRLETLDPGIARYFSSIARFAATVPSGDVSEADFSNLAAAIARGRSMRTLDKAALKPLYQNALSRAGRGGRISLDIAALTHILAGADDAAEKAGASEIRARDIEDAVRHRTSVVVS